MRRGCLAGSFETMMRVFKADEQAGHLLIGLATYLLQAAITCFSFSEGP